MKQALLLPGLVVALAAPAVAGDLDNGRKLAEHWCAACHVVSSDQKRASVDVPTFEDVARRKDARALTLFLTKPHGQMPDMALSQPEIADIVAWIESQGPNPVPAEPPQDKPPSGLSGAIAPSK
ncbi:MAG: cytochrome c [Hyphomicrobiales bacterium]|nr:cytochrome c [Hyphomicrobiales bacterium]